MVIAEPLNDLSEKLRHAAQGLHSNIPSCCVNFFVHTPRDEILRLNEQRHRDYAIEDAFDSLEYVPCPSCFAGIMSGRIKPAKLHRCDNRCPPGMRST